MGVARVGSAAYAGVARRSPLSPYSPPHEELGVVADEKLIVALKRELAGRGRRDPQAGEEIIRELAARGVKVGAGERVVEKRAAAKKKDE